MVDSNLTERIAAQIAPQLPAHSSILIGLSGGVDSVVLLHLLHKLAARFSWQLSALHVHHGISPNADAWADFCVKLCARHYISLAIERVDIAPLRAHGVEAAARKLRHAAFARQSCDFVALGHHADDQAETLLLQLLRGAGVRGASAMPVLSLTERAGRAGSPCFLRPLLHCSRQEIVDYAVAHQLHWIEDESNADDKYSRNFLRHRVMPLLSEKFPACRATLARSAQHFAEASSLLDELAQQDAAQSIHADTLAVAALRALSKPRAKNLLRYFLHGIGAPMPQAVQLDDMLQQLCNARQDAAVCITYGDLQVRRYRGKMLVLRAPGDFDRGIVLPWRGETELDWPALNVRLRFNHMRYSQDASRGNNEAGSRQHIQGAAISLAKLRRAPVTLRLRSGGEAMRVHRNGPARSLKNLLQEHHVPPWRRDRLPLLYCGDELVCVLNVAIAAEYLAAEGEAGVQLSEG